ncbi:MAG: hydrogenase, partial [Gammaproteobacteria bacterium]
PQQMFGAVIKTYYAQKNNIDPKYIVSVSLMPCVAKKFECSRPEMNDSGYKDIDIVLTTEEAAAMIKEAGMDLRKVPTGKYDDPFGASTGSGVIFGATGGVMEAALRTAAELITGLKIEDLFEHANITPVRGFEGSRIAEIKLEQVGEVPDILKGHFDDWEWLKGATLKVGVAHGTANAEKVLADIEAGGPFSECHFIEFMGCPGGCLAGGGMPRPVDMDVRKARAGVIYDEDMSYEYRKSHENPEVAHLYEEFFTEGPCGHKAHELLHTHYSSRGRIVD